MGALSGGPAETPLMGQVELPERVRSPWWELGRRLLLALGILVGTVLLVYLDREGYRDGGDASPADPSGTITLIDAMYYTTVTLSTTGYGDITPVSDGARLVNAFIITPARIAFLVLLIGTTLEVLAQRSRELFRISRWRNNMGHHVVVIGYGTKGRSAVETLVNNGLDRDHVVVVDPSPVALADAHADQLAVVTGDATRRGVLQRARVADADQVIITTGRDDSNVLAALTVRQLNPDAWIVAAVSEQSNAPLMRQSGADSVITSSEAVGRVVGLSSISPNLGAVIEDLLTADHGLEIVERQVTADEVGKSPADIRTERVLGVVRNKTLRQYYDPTVATLETGDRLVVVRHAPGD